MVISFLSSFAFCFSFSQLFVRPPQTTTLPLTISFSSGWFWVLWPPSIVLQALSISDLIPSIYLSLLLYNHKGFDLGTLNGFFSALFNLSLNFAIRSSQIFLCNTLRCKIWYIKLGLKWKLFNISEKFQFIVMWEKIMKLRHIRNFL